MKILHLQTELKIACGITKIIYLLVENTSQEINHSVLTFGGDAIDRFKSAGIDVVVSAKTNGGLQQSLEVLIRIFFLVRKQNIDIIHSHHRYFDFIAFFISKLIRVKTITSVQSKVYGKKIFSYKADCLIACSNYIKEHLINYFRIDAGRITVIHNFVDPKEAVVTKEKTTLKRELGLEDSIIIIGFIGRFSVREKGVDILLESFKKLSSDDNDSRLIMIGDGEDEDYVKNFITSNDLKTILITPKENIYDYYNIIDIVVLPSRIEPFGIVVIEGGLMKKSVIASDIDGLKEIIDNGVNGSLFPYENVKSLTATLKVLIKNSQMRIKFGEELYKKVMNNFTNKKIVPLYKQTYQQLMKDEW